MSTNQNNEPIPSESSSGPDGVSDSNAISIPFSDVPTGEAFVGERYTVQFTTLGDAIERRRREGADASGGEGSSQKEGASKAPGEAEKPSSKEVKHENRRLFRHAPGDGSLSYSWIADVINPKRRGVTLLGTETMALSDPVTAQDVLDADMLLPGWKLWQRSPSLLVAVYPVYRTGDRTLLLEDRLFMYDGDDFEMQFHFAYAGKWHVLKNLGMIAQLKLFLQHEQELRNLFGILINGLLIKPELEPLEQIAEAATDAESAERA